MSNLSGGMFLKLAYACAYRNESAETRMTLQFGFNRRFCIMINFVLKMMNSIFKMMNFVSNFKERR